MSKTDKINGISMESDIDTELNNGVPVGSITPDGHGTVLGDAFKTAFFAGVTKYKIKKSGAPAAGEISLDGGDFDTATTIQISKTDDHANDATLLLALIVKDYVIKLKDYSGKVGLYTVNTKTDSGSYYTLTVTASGSNPSYAPTGLEGFIGMFTKNAAYSGIYGGSGSLISSTNVTMASYTLLFSGTTNSFYIQNGVATSGSSAQTITLDGPANKLTSQNSTVGHGAHELNFQDNPSASAVSITLPLESGDVLVIPQANTVVANPTASQNGFFISWDDASGEYTLTDPKIKLEQNLGDSGAAIAVDLSLGNDFNLRATDNFTLNFSNAPATAKCTQKGYIRILQDPTGSRVLTLGASVISTGGVTPTLTTTAGATDILEYQYNDSMSSLIITAWYLDVK